MANSKRFHLLALPALVWASTVVVGCQELPQHPGRKVQVLTEGGIETRSPADVAIAPVQLAREDIRAPERLLREVVAESLVKRRYSPLALDYVDSRVIDASYAGGAVGEDAVCELVVHEWDEGKWSSGLLIRFDVEMRMIDVRGAGAGEGEGQDEGRLLWAARYQGMVDATPESSHRTEAALYRWAIAQVALELAGALPPRDPVPGRG